MPATVKLINVAITRVYSQGIGVTKQTVYDGTAKYRITTDSIDFEYIHKFTAAQNIATEVINGSAFLKAQLDDLSLAVQNFQTDPSNP